MTFSSYYLAAIAASFIASSLYSFASGRIAIGTGLLIAAILMAILSAWAASIRNDRR